MRPLWITCKIDFEDIIISSYTDRRHDKDGLDRVLRNADAELPPLPGHIHIPGAGRDSRSGQSIAGWEIAENQESGRRKPPSDLTLTRYAKAGCNNRPLLRQPQTRKTRDHVLDGFAGAAGSEMAGNDRVRDRKGSLRHRPAPLAQG